MALRELIAKFGVAIDKGDVSKVDSAVAGLRSKLSGLVDFAAAGIVIGKIKDTVTDLVDLGDRVADTSKQLNISTEEFQRWSQAADQSGASSEGFVTGLKVLQKNVGDALKEPLGTAAKTFKRLGIEVKDATGEIRPSADIFRDAGINIGNLGNESQRTEALLELFGKQGLALGPMFEDGADGIQKLLDAARPVDDETIQSLAETKDNIARMDAAMTQAKAKMLSGFLPALNKGIGYVEKLSAEFEKGSATAHKLESAVFVLGVVAAAAGIKAAIPWLPFIALMVAATLAVDDFRVAAEGGDSETGKLLRDVFDQQTADDFSSWMQQIRKDIEAEPQKSGVTVVADHITHQLHQFVDDVGEIFHLTMGSLNEWAESSVDDAYRWVRGIADTVLQWGMGFPGEMAQMGADIMQGLLDGLSDKAGAITAAIVDPVKGGFDAIAAFAELGSPSKKAKRFTTWMGQGEIDGMRAMQPKIEAQAERSFGVAALPDMQASMPSGGGSSRSTSNQIQQNNNNVLNFTGDLGKSLSKEVLRGVNAANSESHASLLASLEAVSVKVDALADA